MIRPIAYLLATITVLTAVLPGAAQIAETTTVLHFPATPAAGCPAAPPHALAVTFSSGFSRADLQQAALAAVSNAAQKAGLTLVAPQANVLVAIPGAVSSTPIPTAAPQPGAPQPQGLCIPTLVLTASLGPWSAFTVMVTRYSEPVALGTVLALPDGRIFQATSQQTAAWYGGYIPAPYIPNLPVYIGAIPVGGPQGTAEQGAVTQGVSAVLASLLPHLAAP